MTLPPDIEVSAAARALFDLENERLERRYGPQHTEWEHLSLEGRGKWTVRAIRVLQAAATVREHDDRDERLAQAEALLRRVGEGRVESGALRRNGGMAVTIPEGSDGGEMRKRCFRGHLICQKCGSCTYECSDMQTDDGRVTTDSNGRTLHRECRYEEGAIFQ